MTFSNNPIIIAQVNLYMGFLSCTNQNDDVRQLCELVANDDRDSLVQYLETQISYHGQFTTDAAEMGQAHMAKSLLNLIRMF